MRFKSKIRGVVREKMGVGPQNRSFWARALKMLTYEQREKTLDSLDTLFKHRKKTLMSMNRKQLVHQ